MIQAHELVKWYGPVCAIDRLSFQIPQGQVVGFLGPNGAGKSTALRILTGYMPPSSGSASIAGFDVLTQSRAARQHIGYMPESTPLYPEMRVTEYLDYRGKLMQMPRRLRKQRIDAVCDRCGLAHLKRRPVGHLSKGNRQRVGLAQALLHEPPVLILDEPTAGLDPNQIEQVRQLIDELRGRHTVMISTHILSEVEKTADHVLIVASGRIVAQGEPEQLRKQVQQRGRVLVEAQASADDMRQTLAAIQQVDQIQIINNNGWSQAIVSPSGQTDLREPISRAMQQRGMAIRELRHEAASLESFFLQITAEQEHRDV